MSRLVSSPATSPPPKALIYAHTLRPRERGTSNLSGLEAAADVNVLWPATTSTRNLPRPGATLAGAGVGTQRVIRGGLTASDEGNKTGSGHEREYFFAFNGQSRRSAI